ncbi:MAG TPA: hypothetical protein VHB79_34545 [Polyangiaceae bacterium]|nr:hypothetical protein [Polyangiaceae bacterium]
MNKLGFGIGLTALVLVSACGGTSERNGAIFTEGGSAGSGGTAQGGETDAAGAPSNESGGSVTGGGKGNTAGSGMTTAGTNTGQGGAPDAPMPPDPTVKEGCKDYCAGEIAAACDDTKLDDCVFGCRAVSGSPTCNGKYKDLLECAKGKTFTCNKDGDAIPEGCQVQYAQAALCVLGNPDESLAKPCKAYCDAAEAAACTNTTPSGECTYGCQVTSSLVAQCAADWKVFVDCAATAEVTCNDSGDPSPNACAAPYLKYLACFVEAGQ